MTGWRTGPLTFAAAASICMSPLGRSNCQPNHATVIPVRGYGARGLYQQYILSPGFVRRATVQP